jgi:acetyltransferase
MSPAAPPAAPRPGLDPFFAPAAVAVIGASDDPAKVGGAVLANLRAGGYPGRIVPVNARRPVVQGLPAVASLRDADGPVDVAVVTVPAPAVLPALKDCVAHGVRGAVVITAGFRESGPEGRDRETELRRWIAEQPLRVVGPNCLGWIRPARRLNLTFAPGMPRPGALGFFSHSGALCTAILDWSRDHGLGFSLFASLGNQADVSETEVIDALAVDPETRVILGYVEGVAEGRRFFEALRRAAAVKPCVLMKAGRSPAGARAISSHTGALAGSDAAFDAAVAQAGAARAETLEDFFDLARALATQPLPVSRRVVIVTNGGGLGILAADAAARAGLDVAPLAEAARARLAGVLPPTAALGNPVDLVGDAGAARYATALAALHDEPAALVICLAPQAATDASGIARAILGGARGRRAPALTVFSGGARIRAGAQALEEGGVPCYPFPERAVRALAGMVAIDERRRRSEAPWQGAADRARARAHLEALRSAGTRRLGLLDGAPLLEAYGIGVLAGRRARTPEEAAGVAAALGGPVAVKLVSPDITHKTDVGGVRLHVPPAEVAATARAILESARRHRPEARLDGVLVQPMAPGGGTELLLGMVRDAQFGPLVMIGAGGIWVEVLRDTATRLAPLGPGEARAMVEALRIAPALRGARGRPPADLDALIETICRFAALVTDLPALGELEVNPLIVGAAILALDVRGTVEGVCEA